VTVKNWDNFLQEIHTNPSLDIIPHRYKYSKNSNFNVTEAFVVSHLL
jgi:hypothetical protein